MKKNIGIFLFLFAISTTMNAEQTESSNEEFIEESCVSIATELTKDRPDLFQLAYNYCIKQRCNCDGPKE